MKRGFRGVPRPLLPAMLPVVAVDQSAGPADQDPTHPHVPEARTMTVEDLLHLVPNLITKVDSLEAELKQTKLTMGNSNVKLVNKVKKLEAFSKRHRFKGDFVTPTKPLGEAQEEEISPTTLEAAKTLSHRLQTLEEEETAKQVHLDALLAKRIEEEELTEQQKQRKAQVQFEAQHYTEEDWDAIRAKLEANAELTKNVLGKELPEEDFAKKWNYMMNYLKNQGTWKLTQLKKLSFEEVKEEFDKLVKQVESFVPMNIEATKAQLKRYGEELQIEISNKQRIDDKDEEKVTEVKEEKPVIRTGKRKKQKARKGINVDKSPQGDSKTDEEESVEAMNPTPLDTKSNIVAN
ncbi:hypothetical protein Tco_0132918 [Tanacetum coccineum]